MAGRRSMSLRYRYDSIAGKNWPTKAKVLKRDYSGILMDLGCILISIAFIAFGFGAYLIREKDAGLNPAYRHIKNGSMLLPTFFPIAFTALMGKTLRNIAIGLSVRGSRLLTIEQLLQYNSVGAALTTFYKLGVFKLLGISLLFLWAFSPLGGQGGLRMLETYNATSSHEDGFAYYVRSNASTLLSRKHRFASFTLQQYGDQVDRLFTPSLITSVGTQYPTLPERDHLGRFKVPILSSLSGSPDKDGWIEVSSKFESHTNLRYSSALGLPVKTTSTNKRSWFSIEASYLEFKCTDKNYVLRSDISSNQTTMLDSRLEELHYADITQQPPLWLFNITTIPDPNISNKTALVNGEVERTEPQKIAIRSLHFPSAPLGEYALSNTLVEIICTVTEPRIEAIVSCIPDGTKTDGQCEIHSMRASLSKEPFYYKTTGPYSTVLDTNPDGSYGPILLEYIAYAGSITNYLGTVSSRSPVLSELYLWDPTNTVGWSTSPEALQAGQEYIHRWEIDLEKVELKDFEERLTILVNSFHQSTQSSYIRAHGIPANGTDFISWEPWDRSVPATPVPVKDADGRNPAVNFRLALETYPDNLGEVLNTAFVVEERYRVNMPFLIAYLASSIVLFLGVCSSFFFFRVLDVHKVGAPDILGYFSSFTRDNPYMGIEEETGFAGSTLNGDKRAVLLRDFKVRLGDVGVGNRDEGHIAFFREDLYGKEIPRLGSRPNRKYR